MYVPHDGNIGTKADKRKLIEFTLRQISLLYFVLFNPSVAEWFVSTFHSFEAGIADAISSFK